MSENDRMHSDNSTTNALVDPAGLVPNDNPKDHPIESLVEAALRGDQTAWSILVKRYTGLLTWVTRQYSLTPADAADAIQTTWLHCVEHLAGLREPRALGSWLVTTCRRECWRIAGAARRPTLADRADLLDTLQYEPTLDRTDDPESVLLLAERDETLWRAVRRLPPVQQGLLAELMRGPAEGGSADASVAENLHMPVGSIGPTRLRAVARLRQDPELLALDAA